MSEQPQPVAGAAASTTKARTSFGILGAISLSHLLNDMIQSLILAIYPLLQSEFSLTFMQIGMITLTFQLASSLLQPVVGYWTDKYPMPWSLPIGMCFTLSGLVLLALAGSFRRSSAGGRAGRYRFIGLSSGIFSRGPYGFRRAAWPGAIYLSGRRQLWQFPGTLAGGGDYRALWQRQRCLVCACGTAGDCGVGRKSAVGTRHSTE
ncbi:MFS transporter [Escherichia coli]